MIRTENPVGRRTGNKPVRLFSFPALVLPHGIYYNLSRAAGRVLAAGENKTGGGKAMESGNRKSANYTYIVQCDDGSLYTGWTNDMEKRINDHNSGKGAKYTKPRRPVRLVYYERFTTKREAMRREWEIKRLSRKAKIELIRSGPGEGCFEMKKKD